MNAKTQSHTQPGTRHSTACIGRSAAARSGWSLAQDSIDILYDPAVDLQQIPIGDVSTEQNHPRDKRCLLGNLSILGHGDEL